MPLPLSNLCTQGLSALALLAFSATTSVFTLQTTIPNDVSPCQEVVYRITLTNSSPQPQAAGTLQYCLPEGLQYTAVTGLTVADGTDPRCPVFSLPAINGNAGLSFELHVRVGCAAPDQGGARDTIRINAGGTPHDPLFGSEYNVRVPVVSLTPGQNWDYTGATGDLFTRTFTLRNEGFGAVFQLFIIDTFAQTGVQLINTTGTMKGDTLILGGADLGPDGLLSHLDSVVVTQTLRLSGCPNNNLIVQYGWRCPDGETCTSSKFDFYSLSAAFSAAPNVTVSTNAPFIPPGPCTPGPLEIRIANTGNAPALDIEWIAGYFGFPTDPPETWQKVGCMPMRFFSAGFTALADVSAPGSAEAYRIPLSILSADPDGPGGLSDEDGDGQYDDLAPGNSAVLTLNVEFDPTCIACNNALASWYIGSRVTFTNTCGNTVSSAWPANLGTGIAFSGEGFDDANEFLLEAGKEYDFEYGLNLSFTGLDAQCPNDSLILHFILPKVLTAPAVFQPTLDGAALPNWAAGDTLYLLLPKPAGNLVMPLLTVCPPDIDDSAICTPPYRPRTYQAEVLMTWTCGDGCDQELELLCAATDHFTLDCPRPEDTTQMHGIFADSFWVQRVTLGFTDHTMTTRVDLNTPGLALSTAIPYDTVLFRASALIDGTVGDMFDSAQIQVYYFNDFNGPYFNRLNSAITLVDAESGQSYLCDQLVTDEYVWKGYHIWEITLLPLTQPGGCLFAAGVRLTPGDRIELEIRAHVNEDVPNEDLTILDDLRVRFPFMYHGDSVLCKMKNAGFGVINPDYAFSIGQNFPLEVCENLRVELNFFQGYSPKIDTDIFPGEIRPLFVYDSLWVNLGPGYEYVPGSAVWQYDEGDGAVALPVTQQIPLADPTPVILASGAPGLLFLRPPGLPVTDYYKGGAPALLLFDARLLCPPDTTRTLADVAGRRLLASLDRINVMQSVENTGIPDLNELSLTTSAPLSVSRVPTWYVEYCNPIPGFNIPEPLIFISPGATLQLTGATDVTDFGAPEPLALEFPDSNTILIRGLRLDGDDCRTIEITAGLIDCVPDTLTLRPGLQCDNAAPCILDHPLELVFIPKEGFAQINVTESPATAVSLCDPVDYTVKVLNVDEGNLYEVEVLVKLPQAGQVYVPGSAVAVYNGVNVPLPDPVATPDGLLWALDFSQPPFNIDGLPGVFAAPANALEIRFQVETNCEYIDGARFFYSTSWNNVCGARKDASRFVAPELSIVGEPTASNDYQILLDIPFPASFCAEVPLRVTVINPGNLGPSGANEKIRVAVPAGFNYVPGSFQAVHNGPAGPPAQLPFDEVLFLYFNMPPGVAAGDSVIFLFNIQNTVVTPACSESYDFLVQTLQTQNVACDNAGCDIDFITREAPFSTVFEKPSYLLSDPSGSGQSLDANQESWQIEFLINNTAANLPGGGALQVEIRLDVDQNGQLDAADPLLQTAAADVNGLLPGAARLFLETVNVPGIAACSGIWIALTDTVCSCTQGAIYIPFIPLKNSGTDTAVCAGYPLQTGAVPANNYQYEWIPASPWLSDAGAANPVYLYQGNFGGGQLFSETIVLKTTRPAGCVSFDTVQITTRLVNLSLSASPALCWGDSTGSISSMALGAEAPVTYTWNDPALTGDQLTGIPAGDYTLIVVDSLGCADTASVTVTQPEPLSVALTPSDYNGFGISCAGLADGSITATAAGGTSAYQYAWSPAGSGPVLGNLPAGDYTVTVTDTNGCTAEGALTLDEPQPLVLDTLVTDAVCPGGANGEITVSIEGGVAPFSANGQTVTGSVWTQNNLVAGTYTVTVTDANNCSAQISAFVDSLLSTFSLTTDSTTCFGDADGLITIQGNGYPPFQYAWPGGANGAVFMGGAGTYTCTVTDALGCSYLLTAEIEQPALLVAGAEIVHPACFGDSTGQISLNASGGTAPYQFAPAGPVLNGLPDGVYPFLVTDARGCTTAFDAVLTAPAPLNLSLNAVDVVCHGSSTGQVNTLSGGGVPPFSFQWSNGAGGANLNGVPAGVYTVTLTDANGCTITGSGAVQEPPAYEPVFTPVQIPCAGKTNGVLSVENLPSGTLFGLDQQPFTKINLFERVRGGVRVLQIKDSLGCVFQFEYEMPELPLELGRVFSDTIIHIGDSVLLYTEINPALPPGIMVDVQWLSLISALDSCGNCPELWVKPLRTTPYPVRFTTPEGCVWEQQALVGVLRDSVYAPNVISIDAQQPQNQYFTLYSRPGALNRINSLRIFDRWGELVFERLNFAPNEFSLGWNGAWRGQKPVPGVFVWYAEVEYADGAAELLKGDVTVLR